MMIVREPDDLPEAKFSLRNTIVFSPTLLRPLLLSHVIGLYCFECLILSLLRPLQLGANHGLYCQRPKRHGF